LTRLQRAAEGSGQSTRRRGDHVIQRRGVRLQDRWRNPVVFRHSAMHAEYYWLLFRWKVRSAYRARQALNSYLRTIDDVRHESSRVRI
jgi:hypothetical protein